MIRAFLFLLGILGLMASFLPIIGLLRLTSTRLVRRHVQVLIPGMAVLWGIAVSTDLLFVQTVFGVVQQILSGFFPWFATPFGTLWLFNYLYAIVFCILKVIVILMMGRIQKKFPQVNDALYDVWYEYSKGDNQWTLKEQYRGARSMARAVFYITTFCCCAVAVPAFFGVDGFLSIYYPSMGIVATAEVYYFLMGETRSERAQRIEVGSDGSVRLHSYAKVIQSLRHDMDPYLLHDVSYALRQLPNSGDAEFCNELASSGSYASQIAGLYYREHVKHNLLSSDGSAPYGPLERAAVMGSIKLMEGESVLVASPFFRDFTPYLFLAVSSTLLRNKNVVFVHGSSMNEHDIVRYVNEGLELTSNVAGIWSVSPLVANGSERPNIATLSFARMGDIKLLLGNEAYLQSTGLVVVVNGSNLLSACPYALDAFAGMVNSRESCTFCIFDRNADGLVDALSHALRTSIVEVTATAMSHGTTIGAFWDVTGPGVQQRLMPGVSRYLGMAPEIGMVALRGQVEKVGWVGRRGAPLADQRWILAQYYREVFDYADLPQDQEQIDRRFDFIVDPCAVKRMPEQFLMVEDEYNNLFETYRQYSSRGMNESFVNVLSDNYLLRDYMVDNALVFEHDPKAIPCIAPDYPRSARNAAVSLALRMLEGSQFVSTEEISRTLRYLGYPCAKVQMMTEKLFDTYVLSQNEGGYDSAKTYIVTRTSRRYNEQTHSMVEYTCIGLRESAHLSPCFEHLACVELITEKPDGSSYNMATKMMGLVWQSMLPGQFAIIEGKYYEVLSISASGGVVLRRAADHFTARHTYRQLRTYEIAHADLDTMWEQETSRTIHGVLVESLYLDVGVRTDGYLELTSRNDVCHARRVQIDNVPRRFHAHKASLRIVLPNLSRAATRTTALLMSEAFASLFPNEYEYVAVLTDCAEELPEGLLYRMVHAQSGKDAFEMGEGHILIVEDSPIDLGIIAGIERNIERILEICADYLMWFEESAQESAVLSEEGQGNEPGQN